MSKKTKDSKWHEKTKDFPMVMDNLRKALSLVDGQKVARVYNSVCDNKIRYLGDSTWREVD